MGSDIEEMLFCPLEMALKARRVILAAFFFFSSSERSSESGVDSAAALGERASDESSGDEMEADEPALLSRDMSGTVWGSMAEMSGLTWQRSLHLSIIKDLMSR